MKQLKNLELFYDKNKNKTFYSSLINIHGINIYILKKLELLNGFNKNIKINNLNLLDLNYIKEQIIFYFDLEKNKILKNINKYKKIKNYRGMRHILKLPVRGQRTHTNGKTIKRYSKIEI